METDSENVVDPVVPSASAEAELERAFREFVQRSDFPCLGARSVVRLYSYSLRVYGALGRMGNSRALLDDLASFTAEHSEASLSAFVAVFPHSPPENEIVFERRLWQQLQMIHDVDPQGANWAAGVSSDPHDPHFSFSAGGRAFFVVGLHPESSRLARRFIVPALVFNPHEQFSRLRAEGKFDGLRAAIRARDIAFQGNENPNVADFGERSEAGQYSGRQTEGDWKCPFRRKP
ncbi:MAG TPA: guanitoxin biosynthesis heme-dependent pre-guanitoxin N-hydroxylase GntA [Gemmatimonadaceae bacterium]|nr:guanitoxin biosynthesis heme-dependent pre-guanitoxin N-hydroxylase GntA [Gemmatimonadaceae bacterium]